MKQLMDKLFISVGFDAAEIRASTDSGWLYVGIVYFLGLASAFVVMAIVS